MDSKLPKPSGLRRPAPVFKSILPSDRIRPPGFGGAKSQSTLALIASEPLSTDLTNIPFGLKGRTERAASPEVRTRISPSRAKLRRSRSACDLNDIRRPLKRPEPTLAPIPAKSTRFMTNPTGTSKAAAVFKSLRVDDLKTTEAVKRPIKTARPPVKRAGSAPRITTTSTTTNTAPTRKPAASSSTSVSTTGAGKPINKRIPPYDYKARYNDLLERTKAVKSDLAAKTEQLQSLEGLVDQYEELQAQHTTVQDQLKNTITENECLHSQVNLQSSKINTLTSNLAAMKEELENLRHSYDLMKKEHKTLSVEVVELRDRTASLSEQNEQLLTEINACKDQLFMSNIERKELHNVIMDLRGNIRVFCRVRPPLDCESDKLMCSWNYLDEATVEIINPDLVGKNKPGSHVFNFDHVFHPGSTQCQVFEMVSPLIQSALDGYNVCIFAYGQTGSGKTYTMDGVPSNAGVIPRTVDLLFESIKNYKRLGWEYNIKVTFLEIYNEVLYDLLSNEAKDMEIRMVKNSKNDIYVSNITEESVTTADQLRHLMQIAKMNRATASTVGNERSSRSHAVTKLELIGRHEERNEISIGSINLVDLAGSESPKTSTRMNETKNINRSLSELTNVILALLQKQDHIPYRNSKLTHLLMPSLGGNSKTLMFINVSPFQDCFVESVKSLRFAASVNSCKLAKAKRNRFLNTSTNS